MGSRPAPSNEMAIRAAIIRRLPVYFGKDAVWWSNSPSPYGTSGRPDLEVIHDGGHFTAIVVKAGRYGQHPESGLSKEQRATLLKISRAGGSAYVANTPELGQWVPIR